MYIYRCTDPPQSELFTCIIKNSKLLSKREQVIYEINLPKFFKIIASTILSVNFSTLKYQLFVIVKVYFLPIINLEIIQH